jgi:uncharacterized membrane protein
MKKKFLLSIALVMPVLLFTFSLKSDVKSQMVNYRDTERKWKDGILDCDIPKINAFEPSIMKIHRKM